MQVNLAPVLTPGSPPGQNTALVLSLLKGFSAFGLQTAVTPQQQQEQLAEQRRDADERQAALAAAPGPAEIAFQAERRLDPSSRTWRRQQARAEARQQKTDATSQYPFRGALHNANSRGDARHKTPAVTSDSSPKPESPTLPDTQGPRADRTAGGDRPSAAEAPGRPGATRLGGQSGAPVHLNSTDNQARIAAATARPAAPTTPAIRVVNTAAETPSVASPSAKPVGNVKAPTGTAVVQADAHDALRSARTSAKAPTGAHPAQAADREENIERILRTISGRLSKARSTAVLRLDPPELGSVRLHMDLRENALTLRVDTQTQVAHRLLTQELDVLRQGLESAGIHLERAEVRPPSPPPEGVGGEWSQQADAGQQEQHQSADAATEHPHHQGTDAHGRPGTDAAGDGSMPANRGAMDGLESPAAESLVNVLA